MSDIMMSDEHGQLMALAERLSEEQLTRLRNLVGETREMAPGMWGWPAARRLSELQLCDAVVHDGYTLFAITDLGRRLLALVDAKEEAIVDSLLAAKAATLGERSVPSVEELAALRATHALVVRFGEAMASSVDAFNRGDMAAVDAAHQAERELHAHALEAGASEGQVSKKKGQRMAAVATDRNARASVRIDATLIADNVARVGHYLRGQSAPPSERPAMLPHHLGALRDLETEHDEPRFVTVGDALAIRAALAALADLESLRADREILRAWGEETAKYEFWAGVDPERARAAEERVRDRAREFGRAWLIAEGGLPGRDDDGAPVTLAAQGRGKGDGR